MCIVQGEGTEAQERVTGTVVFKLLLLVWRKDAGGQQGKLAAQEGEGMVALNGVTTVEPHLIGPGMGFIGHWKIEVT